MTWRPTHSRRSGEAESFTTLGVDSDQMAAAVIATEKMLNAVIARSARPKQTDKTSRASGGKTAKGKKTAKRSRSSAR